MDLPSICRENEVDLSLVDVHVGAKEMCVWYSFKLNWFPVEPFVREFCEGFGVEDSPGNDCESVVHVSVVPHGFAVLDQPFWMLFLPFFFSKEDRNGAYSGGDLVAYG